MTAFTYNTAVPAAANNPSVDQPQMLINTQAINNLLGVDHVSFNSAGSGPPNGSGGHHLQVSFDSKNVAGAVTDPVSVLYTNSGKASSVSDMYFRNANSIFPISILRAWGIIDGTTGVQDATQSINFTSTGGSGTYNVTLDPGVVNSNNFGVLISLNTTNNLIAKFQITGANTFTVTTGTAPNKVIIAVFQL